MAGYKDLYYYVLNLSYSERKNVARKASTEIKKTLEKSIDEDKILNVLLGGICTFICSDNTVDPKEYDFFIDFTGTKIDYVSFIELVKPGANLDYIRWFRRFVDSDEKLKSNFVILGLCFCACNGTITVEEQKFIESLE